MSCAYRCNEVGGPWIAENPDCPIHGADGIGKELDQMDDMRDIIRSLIEELENHTGGAYGMELSGDAQELIERARQFT